MPALSGRPGVPLFSLRYRILAVHYEAFAAYYAQNRLVKVIWVILRLPANIIKLTIVWLETN
mgnify:CR=1 FL=1